MIPVPAICNDTAERVIALVLNEKSPLKVAEPSGSGTRADN